MDDTEDLGDLLHQQAQQQAIQQQVETASPDQKAMLAALYKKQEEDDLQKKELLRKQLQIQLQNAPTNIDFTPLAAQLQDMYGTKAPVAAAAANLAANKEAQTGIDKTFDTLTKPDKAGLGIKDILGQSMKADKEKRLQIQGDSRIQLSAGKYINQNPVIVQLDKQSNAIGRAIDLLKDPNQVLDPQTLNVITADISNAVSGGGQSAEGTREAQAWHSYKMDLTRLSQRIQNKPEDINSPEVRQFLLDLSTRLKNSYDTQGQRTVQRIVNGLSLTPGAQGVLNAQVSARAPKPDEPAPKLKAKAPIKKTESTKALPSNIMTPEEADAMLKSLGH